MIEMKHSGIDWIGEIPAHWEVKRLKDIVTSGSGTTPKSSNEKYYDNGIYPWLITGDVQNNVITSNDIFITDLAVSEVTNLKLFPPKTVLLAMYGGGTIGNVGLMTYPAYINQACCALIPSKNIAEKYLFYYLLNKQKRIISTGVGGTQINLSQNKIVAYPIAIPPIEEQQAIADYLDEKTAEIDEQITLLEQKQKAYVNLKQRLISQVVTRGLNPNAPLKNIGVDWIGEIPAHWEIRRLKDIANFYTGNSLNESEKEIYGENMNPNSLPYIGTKDVERNKSRINYNSGYSIPNDNTSFAIAPKGTTLICVEGGSAGKKIGFLEQDVCFVNKLCCAKSLIDNDKFVYYYFNTNLFVNQFNRLLQGMIGGVSINKIKCMLFFVPPIEEQQAIADYLDEKTAEIDEQISNIDKKINTYKRLKQSLIDEVVTGKRKI